MYIAHSTLYIVHVVFPVGWLVGEGGGRGRGASCWGRPGYVHVFDCSSRRRRDDSLFVPTCTPTYIDPRAEGVSLYMSRGGALGP